VATLPATSFCRFVFLGSSVLLAVRIATGMRQYSSVTPVIFKVNTHLDQVLVSKH
jgi:hypothetical protein